MKKLIALLLVIGLMLCGCSGAPDAETTAPATEAPTTEAPVTVPPTTEVPTEAPTEAPTEPPVIYTNPLTGEALEAESDSRTFAVTINNVAGAMPMYGVSKADLFFEMYVNDHATRGLALFSDITEASAVGSVRSLRYNFTDLCQTYDAVIFHASGSKVVLQDRNRAGVDFVSVESELADYYFRDQARLNQGYKWEHCLFIKGEESLKYAAEKGIRTTRKENADYGLLFTQDGTPLDGEDASLIQINLKHDHTTKQSIMQYDAERGNYQFIQYGKAVYDGAEKQDVCFENVIVMFCNVYNDGIYHVAELVGSGEGYFACGGKIIPIKWSHESMDKPILFTLEDGTPLELGVGSSYIALAPLKSTMEWE